MYILLCTVVVHVVLNLVFVTGPYYWYTTSTAVLVPVPVPTTKSVASLCGLRLVVWPKFGTDPARVAFGPMWSFYQNYGTGSNEIVVSAQITVDLNHNTRYSSSPGYA